MTMRRTPWWQYMIAALAGCLLGVGVAKLSDSLQFDMLGAPVAVSVVMLVMGLVVLALAIQVHTYARTDPKKRTRRLDPERAVNTLILSKALGLAAAFLLGWYGVQLVVALPHGEAPYYASAIRECAIAAAVSLIDMIIGIISEWFCQLPPDEGPENPKIKEHQRQQRQLARGGVAKRS
ncbi:DUF3180 domain-containing protein [Bifidobacterium thermacidophilum]|uniref:DUF3180 domain-containing protein n=1 Tax=Bifidobacterium thermacidophilum TaxID=246618 RepID=A0ABW8KNA1_9BIFI